MLERLKRRAGLLARGCGEPRLETEERERERERLRL